MPEITSLKELAPPLLVEARLESHPLADVAGETMAQMNQLFASVPLAGKRVAVAVGSRGIAQLPLIVRIAVERLRSFGADPFIFPAMGSHGGGTSEGQRTMLESLGVTEESAGAPIDSTMETIQLGQSAHGIRLIASRPAIEAGAILFINRIKPHTDFSSTRQIGSGLRKMCLIGLGKIEGAFEYHRAARRIGFESMLLEVSSEILSRVPNIFGLGLLEDGYHQLAHIEGLHGAEFASREPELFKLADQWMPRLPFREIDVLIIDEIGKNISGAGMDPNVTGRDIHGLPRPDRRSIINTIFVRGLTPESHGNAIGLGYADLVSTRLVAEMDRQITYTNSLSSMTPASVRIPMHYGTDRECLAAAVRMSGKTAAEAHLVQIRNTLALNRLVVSQLFEREIEAQGNLTILERLPAWDVSLIAE
ncbi:MAG: hypothetical protein EBU88_13410 [Acidobacteria bacterium]|nr:hypothetical protein [Acidobacteriota bacterium]